ncbi:MAG TPA: type I restriction enzyme HsdR N-terminal domain-containing protein [Cyclobacteriaceae bacterium]|nr:type I restriction enzyme HsdR N-terminal domain-containing protein [Cyclobacteriaceae bacterium]HRJ83355.1 type I restriction enzyme HsdR N-terminal domain-containing protein [Cyclobacteriaceae bacterium]
MIKLNLPAFDYKLKKADGKVWIFDGIRKKYVVLTPEEWVRQHFVQYLIHVLSYPKALVKIEGGLHYNQLAKRSDIVVFNRAGNPWMVVECKAPEIKLRQQDAQQVAVYNSTLKASYVVITNGLRHLCFEMATEIKSLPELPAYPA